MKNLSQVFIKFLSGFLMTFVIAGILGIYITEVKMPYWQRVSINSDLNLSLSHSYNSP